MRTILMIKAGSQYDALRVFCDEIVDGLKCEHCCVTVFDARKQNLTSLPDELRNKYDLVINFNGYLNDNNEFSSLFNKSKATLISIYVDHPLYHMSRINNKINRNISFYSAQSHVHCMDINKKKLGFFLPMGGVVDKTNDVSSESLNDFTRRSDSILYACSNYGVAENTSPRFHDNDFINKIFLDILNKIELGDVFDDIIDEIAISYKLNDASKCKVYHHAFNKIYAYHRARVRGNVLKALLESNLMIDVYSNGDWSEMESKYKNLRYHKPISMRGYLSKMKEHKFNINDFAIAPDGPHDRVFNTLLHGGVLVTYNSLYLDNTIPNNSIVRFDFKSIDSLPKKIEFLIKKPELAYNIARNGYSIALQHTFHNRVKMILGTVDSFVDW